MKLRRAFRLHGLKRPRIRQSWNKYNLFNLRDNLRIPPFINKTFFQQKWMAKALARGYHGEHIKERQWERMFSRRLASVVEMDPRYMAEFDGSEQAAGRGSGRQRPPSDGAAAAAGDAASFFKSLAADAKAGSNLRSKTPTPYMNMAFAPMERRLDIAVFRSMFASSARQARQFVVHGAVTVNGKKMIYPGYLLNPGDMYQVDVERVLFATGAKKTTSRMAGKAQTHRAAEEAEEEVEEAENDAEAEAGTEAAAGEDGDAAAAASSAVAAARNSRALRKLPDLATRAKQLLATSGDELTAKRKKQLRQFIKDTRKWVSKASSPAAEPQSQTQSASATSPPSTDVVDRLADLLAALPALRDAASASTDNAPPQTNKKTPTLTDEERARFHQLIARDAENPYDPSKPYATPWRPRPFMAAFAFIPRYLEVNHNICAGVYLRHPVARPGLCEVPTPFPYEISQLAFNWYLRRR